tara:strand:- start:4373 stop:4690 length:318 start_codon:yes stop_codon:yes gene_type:complete
MIRLLELNPTEFDTLSSTDCMIVFMSTKFLISSDQADYIRVNASMPFHIRPADYPQKENNEYVIYFSSSEEAIKFQLQFENQTRNKTVKPVPNITSIKSKIDPKD